jgi:aconitate hydratase
MGILPLPFAHGEGAESLGLTGRELFEVEGLAERIEQGLAQGREVRVRAQREDGSNVEFTATIRIDTPQEVLYYKHGGILQYVLRELLSGRDEAQAVSMGPATMAHCNAERPCDRVVDVSSDQSFPASDAPAY